MTQFFDALERQLVAVSRDAPRMTPQARAKRRLAIGTVTVLCLLACMAGTSLLPRADRAAVAPRSVFATLRSAGAPAVKRAPRVQAIAKSGSPANASYGLAGGCGRTVPVSGSSDGGRIDVDAGEGHLQGLVCSMRVPATVRVRARYSGPIDRSVEDEAASERPRRAYALHRRGP